LLPHFEAAPRVCQQVTNGDGLELVVAEVFVHRGEIGLQEASNYCTE
jgi:hypothetical protein